MRRALLLVLGVAAITWLEYEFFPGHSYLRGETQIYVPILERLDSPGFLSRDLVATHPNVTYTIYDEVTLFLHGPFRLSFLRAVQSQQILCRIAAVSGAFLLALSAGLPELTAFVLAAILNLGVYLSGPAVFLVDREPVPQTFAVALVLLACGLLSRGKPLLAGLSGGLALVYDPVIAAPFWMAVLAAAVVDRRLRPLMRPALTIFLIFTLLLANLAQLQPGAGDPHAFFSRISISYAHLQQYRTDFAWVSHWASGELWHYLAIFICGTWATARIWPTLDRTARWFFAVLPLCGVLSVLFSYVLLDQLRWSFVPRVQPMRILLFTAAFCSLACGIAGIRAARMRKIWECWLWLVIFFLLPINAQILEFLHVTGRERIWQLGIALALAGALTLLLKWFVERKWKALVLIAPAAAIFALWSVRADQEEEDSQKDPILEVASWAEASTWGSSMFLFPDAGQALYPGIFRAASLRAVWVDWYSGRLTPQFESFATEWRQRWRDAMQPAFFPQRLQRMQALPIDYYVLKRANQLANARPLFENREFVVYDARDLK